MLHTDKKMYSDSMEGIAQSGGRYEKEVGKIHKISKKRLLFHTTIGIINSVRGVTYAVSLGYE